MPKGNRLAITLELAVPLNEIRKDVLTKYEALILDLYHKRNMRSLAEVYLEFAKYRGYICFPLNLDKMYIILYRAFRRLVKYRGIMRVVEPDEKIKTLARAIHLARHFNSVKVGDKEIKVKEADVEDFPMYILRHLVNNYITPSTLDYRALISPSLMRRLGLLKLEGGNKYSLTPEGLNKILNELERRLEVFVNRVNEILFHRKSRLSRIRLMKIVHYILLMNRGYRKLVVRTEKIDKAINYLYQVVNEIDDVMFDVIMARYRKRFGREG